MGVEMRGCPVSARWIRCRSRPRPGLPLSERIAADQWNGEQAGGPASRPLRAGAKGCRFRGPRLSYWVEVILPAALEFRTGPLGP